MSQLQQFNFLAFADNRPVVRIKQAPVRRKRAISKRRPRLRVQPEDQREKLAYASVAPATAKTYRCLLARLDGWLHKNGHDLTGESVALYILHLHRQGRAPRSISLVRDAVRFRQKQIRKQPNPTGEDVENALKIIMREGYD